MSASVEIGEGVSTSWSRVVGFLDAPLRPFTTFAQCPTSLRSSFASPSSCSGRSRELSPCRNSRPISPHPNVK